MKSVFCILFLSSILFNNISAQKSTVIDSAYANALKGVYWGLENIPSRKNSITNELVSFDELIAKVKVIKEINGIRIEVTGYYKTHQVFIKTYKSEATLKREGYLD